MIISSQVFKSFILGLAVMIVSAAVSEAAIVSNLLAHFPLDETSGTTADNTVSGNDGTNSATVGLNQPAIIGTGYSFVGGTLGPYSNTPNSNTNTGTFIGDDLVNTNKASFSFWANPTFFKTGAGFPTGSDARTAVIATGANLFVGYNATGLLFLNYNNGADVTSTSVAPAATAGSWSQVTITRGGTVSGDGSGLTGGNEVKFYLNGILIDTKTTATGNFSIANTIPSDGATSTTLGRYVWLGSAFTGGTLTNRDYTGLLDDVGVWSGRALSGQEVALINGLGKFAGVALDNSSMDSVLAAFNAGSGNSATSGGYNWAYASGLGSSIVGTTGGTTGGGNAFIVLDSSGNGVQLSALVPEPATCLLLAMAALPLGARRVRRNR